MTGRKSKTKGDSEERSIVNLHRDWGFRAERTLEKGARSDGSATWDIDIYAFGEHETPLIGECKCRESIGDWVWKYLGENDFLTLRKNRKQRLYVMPENIWKRLLDR